jgi:hypothetical protein
MQGGILYRLVCESLVKLGGTCKVEWGRPLRLPLTAEALERTQRELTIRVVLALTALAATVLATLFGLGFVLWKVLANAI